MPATDSIIFLNFSYSVGSFLKIPTTAPLILPQTVAPSFFAMSMPRLWVLPKPESSFSLAKSSSLESLEALESLAAPDPDFATVAACIFAVDCTFTLPPVAFSTAALPTRVRTYCSGTLTPRYMPDLPSPSCFAVVLLVMSPSAERVISLPAVSVPFTFVSTLFRITSTDTAKGRSLEVDSASALILLSLPTVILRAAFSVAPSAMVTEAFSTVTFTATGRFNAALPAVDSVLIFASAVMEPLPEGPVSPSSP